MLQNGNFSSGFDNWNLYLNMGASGFDTVVDRVLNVNFENAGTVNWHVQLAQSGIPVLNGKLYDVSFDASAIQARNINVSVSQDGGSYTSYFSQAVTLNTVMKNYSYSFTMNKITDNVSRFSMDIGNSAIGLKFDNIIVREHVLTSIGKLDKDYPSEKFLSQNHPNPFRSETTINYTIPVASLSQTGNSGSVPVTLKIYNTFGAEVAVLVHEDPPAGNYQVSFNAGKFSSGIYFCKLMACSINQTIKLILVK